ncbi:MAG: hypothetical protein K2R98_23490 [Gemmataceae bacterium]|nr:hypothetical protein [Gemmataceae bacterium]
MNTQSSFSARIAFLAGALLFLGLNADAQEKQKQGSLITFKVDVLAEDPFSPLNKTDVTMREFKRGEVISIAITGVPKAGYHTYPITQRTISQKSVGLSTLKFTETAGLKPLWPIVESKPTFVDTKISESGTWLEFEHPFAWSVDLLIPPDAPPGPKTVQFAIRAQVCNDKGCNWEDYQLHALVNVSTSPPVSPSAEVEARLKEKQPAIVVVPTPAGMPVGTDREESSSAPAPTESKTTLGMADSAAEHKAGLEAVLKELQSQPVDNKNAGMAGLLAFMLTGVFWGAVSLVTPCVFPMIPITVSFFLKQSEKQHFKPITMASVYCGTIVVVLTIAAVALLSLFRWLSVSPIMNFGLGALFVFFALSLFGMYEIELPSGLARFTSSREGQGGLVGTIFMALTFTIISFACVAPFLGGFGGTSTDSSITFAHRLLGGFAFAFTFAAPFFVLALFPNLLKKMPKSGSWLNSVKVVMGFLELAAALKFFRAGELVLLPKPVFFTFDLVLGIWIAMSVLTGMYLLNFYRLPHDTPLENIGVIRMLFGLAFVSLALYLLPAQFKAGADGEAQRPNGTIYAWVDSFLLPEPTESKGELAWSGNLKKVIDEARADALKTGKPKYVFVDFTGETCTNCKINEKSVFIKPEIRGLFQHYLLAQMYTDKVPDKFYPTTLRSRFGSNTARQRDDAAANLWFQRAAFSTEQLPLYVILWPKSDGKIEVVGKYVEGKINSEAEFAQFLKGPLESNGARAELSGR